MLKYDFPWLKNVEIKNLFKIFNQAGIEARFVGGCIRDFLLKLPVTDIDIATPIPPEEMFFLLNQNKFMAIPTGIQYGTITVVFQDGEKIEITTLRQDLETDGRYTKVQYTNDWSKDALRRDFTINALYADIYGKIYDPTGQGIEDIKNHTIRFIGNAKDRIKEDYLRILRFFRFAAICNSKIDQDLLNDCLKFKDKLKLLSRERIKMELEKLLASNNCYDVVMLMLEYKVFDSIFSYLTFDEQNFTKIKESGSWELCDAFVRLISLIDQDKLSLYKDNYKKSQTDLIVYFLRKDLRLSNVETQKIKDILQVLPEDLVHLVKQYSFSQSQYDFEKACLAIKCHAYHSNVQSVLLALILQGCNISNFLELLNWKRPRLPINGHDILKVAQDEVITGTILCQIEQWWISHNFLPNRDDCLSYMLKLLEK